MKKNAFKMPVLFAALTGLMTALVFAFTMIGINIGTGYINIGDTMIFITAALFGPLPASIAGGLGALLADIAVYPPTAVFSLFIKAIEGALAGVLLRYVAPKLIGKHPKTAVKILSDAVCCLIAGAVMVAGYFATSVLFWGEGDSPATRLSGALLQLPWDILQCAVSLALSNLILNLMKLSSIAAKFKVGRYMSDGKTKTDASAQETSVNGDDRAADDIANTDSDNIGNGDCNTGDSDDKAGCADASPHTAGDGSDESCRN